MYSNQQHSSKFNINMCIFVCLFMYIHTHIYICNNKSTYVLIHFTRYMFLYNKLPQNLGENINYFTQFQKVRNPGMAQLGASAQGLSGMVLQFQPGPQSLTTLGSLLPNHSAGLIAGNFSSLLWELLCKAAHIT